ncbi:BMC domain-containing protein [Clostridium grantii]|uniref:BMC domain-containing protein n=1 Tax=Clostridium grantii DSM 8605 TaxID=1121316 RepID=A0A1M5WGI9_9CLOT|nr:BMC domain-containing protein [Clostridium grantii]SHH86669.1 BMC domain-containing protein [Clostridium grantii DSM 8605]
MQSIGLIETKGLLAAIEAADAMVKSADVNIVEKTYVGGGLVTIIVTGDVGAVKAAIEAGVAAVKKLDQESLVSEHIIPRPHEELKSIIGYDTLVEGLEVPLSDKDKKDVYDAEENKNVEDIKEAKEIEETKETKEIEEIEETEDKCKEDQDDFDTDLEKLYKVSLENLHKSDVDNLVSKDGIEKTILILSKMKVVKLRNLAREYKDFVITGRTISKAGKNLLITKFKLHYEKK